MFFCFFFLFDVTRMEDWQIENNTVQTCLSWEGDNIELSTQQNLLTVYCVLVWCGRRVIAYESATAQEVDQALQLWCPLCSPLFSSLNSAVNYLL